MKIVVLFIALCVCLTAAQFCKWKVETESYSLCPTDKSCQWYQYMMNYLLRSHWKVVRSGATVIVNIEPETLQCSVACNVSSLDNIFDHPRTLPYDIIYLKKGQAITNEGCTELSTILIKLLV